MNKKTEIADAICCDLLKKINQLSKMDKSKSSIILEGLVDGLLKISFQHPSPGVPDFLKSMDPNYCSGYSVGVSWLKSAKLWEETNS
jgi:hypothetical protein